MTGFSIKTIEKKNKMNNIRVDIRLRPIRLGFLVRPDDAENVLEIFRINTCLWGGRFNPIIPFFDRVPSRSEKGSYHFENPKQIINGYLDFFEPDFLVEAEKGLATGFGFDSERILQLTDILERSAQRGWDQYGLTVYKLYSELYNEEFRFELRHQPNEEFRFELRYQPKIVHVEAKERVFAGFTAANFGSFPTQELLWPLEHRYKEVFNPEHITLDAAALSELYQSSSSRWYQSRYNSALEIGHKKLQISRHDRGQIRLCILDAHESKDLIDFWNLRAVHQTVFAVPIQWIQELSPFSKEICRKFGALMFSDSISENDRENIHNNYLRVDKRNDDIPQIGYLPIWLQDRTIRPTLEADRRSIGVQIDEDDLKLRFDPLFPKFANADKYSTQFCVANVVRLQDWNHIGQVATVFPCNYKDPTFPKFEIGEEYLLPTNEGLVVFPHTDIPKQWHLVDGTTAFSEWFDSKQVSVKLSDAGRATQQIIQTLGDFWGVGCLAHKGIIELLNEMSKKSATKTTHYKEFKNKIHAAIDNESLKKEIFETLVERKAVELGLELKCDKCDSPSWYSVKQLDYSLTCSFCFKQFNFPITSPIGGHSKWSYRVVGPFVLPDYARGGYAAALAIRFFADVIGGTGRRSAVTWSSGQEMTLYTGKKVEADFILWYQRNRISFLTEMVFGEAKSFGKGTFKQDDVDNLKVLAETFPGSILVFATMREDISQEEIDRIKELAEWGREYDGERGQTRAPVIVLTGTELFITTYLDDLWKAKGGKHKNLILAQTKTDNLRVLADLTQQLYLGMPPYEEART